MALFRSLTRRRTPTNSATPILDEIVARSTAEDLARQFAAYHQRPLRDNREARQPTIAGVNTECLFLAALAITVFGK